MRRRLSACFLALALALLCTACGGETAASMYLKLDDGIERTIIEVATRSEMTALRNQDLSNTEIHLTADAYDLGDSIFMVKDAVNLRIIGNASTTISGGRNGGGCIFFANNCENLLLYQIAFGNQYDGDINECVSLSKCSNVQIDNCVFFNAMRGLSGAGSGAVVNGCEIRNCVEGSKKLIVVFHQKHFYNHHILW